MVVDGAEGASRSNAPVNVQCARGRERVERGAPLGDSTTTTTILLSLPFS